jgi:hypothetical protein
MTNDVIDNYTLCLASKYQLSRLTRLSLLDATFPIDEIDEVLKMARSLTVAFLPVRSTRLTFF